MAPARDRRSSIALWSALGIGLATGCMGVSDPALVTVPLSSLFPDGGVPGRDAGPDAGSVPPDSGVTAPDAGTPDAGGSPDAGSTPDAGGVDAAVDLCAGVGCGTGGHCAPATGLCTCLPGFTPGAAGCEPVMPGSPASRTQAEVCDAYAAGQQENAIGDGFTVSGATCDLGVLSREAIDDGLRRLNFHRWLVGLGPTADNAGENDKAQACSLVSAWNAAGPSAHSPQPTATCYTPAGAAGAGSSNIAWGCNSAPDAIDQWIIDWGNETTFGHRRWLFNPPLNNVGIGYYRGGNNYGSASCITIFGGGGSSSANWLAFPPPGFVPLALAQWPWTAHGNVPLTGATATVVRQSDGASLPVTYAIMSGGYGQPAGLITRTGWNPTAGEVYRVTISNGSTTLTYDVKPVTCP